MSTLFRGSLRVLGLLPRVPASVGNGRALSAVPVQGGRVFACVSTFAFATGVASAFCLGAASCDAPSGTDDVIAKESRLYNENKTQELYEMLRAHYETHGDNTSAEVLWRLARATRDVADNTKSLPANEKKRFIYDALNLAKKAVEKDPNCFAAHKWYAICLSRVGDYEGNKAKILNAYKIRDHFDRAAALNPTDATTQHLIGLWCFSLADMSWWETKAAATLFATPPTSTYDEALGAFQKAEELDPGFYTKNTMMIGKVLLRMGKKEEARKHLEATLKMKVTNLDDQEALDEARALLKTI